MTSTATGAIQRHEIDDYLNSSLVENIADLGAFMNIKVYPEYIENVFEHVSKIPGVNAYKHDDIPDRYHFRDNKYIHDIILMAQQGYFIMASKYEKQLPPRSSFAYVGAHGYNPDIKDMKGIFFARGPAFKCGWTIEPIHVVDIYQVLTHVLQLTPQPHNGTWDRVNEIFADDTDVCTRANTNTIPAPVMCVLFVATLFTAIMN
ncbi:Ectonucleotide pyrophosphatase/phosphodiesterase family member 6-like 2 [Homarus americanus]|uniref:Ectonucleotide pyrophosphatase/phosphodiesterase family member 6-like 2 n=2 Tax=Homarus americanus TaxID=6706 RepID=A0A8J5MGV5_HOMAM|nr:Ectonucleotide pyrophosphatase/phosphodiesterase family member 6-like 2 [Homarus americanus]